MLKMSNEEHENVPVTAGKLQEHAYLSVAFKKVSAQVHSQLCLYSIEFVQDAKGLS